MPSFEYKAFEREVGGPCWGLPNQTFAFEAEDEAVAKYTAYARVGRLPPGCFAVLCDASGTQLWSGQSAAEP
jgi:hypothetical protein